MRKKYILLDLDGTITDSGEGITKSVQYALEKMGIEENDILLFFLLIKLHVTSILFSLIYDLIFHLFKIFSVFRRIL